MPRLVYAAAGTSAYQQSSYISLLYEAVEALYFFTIPTVSSHYFPTSGELNGLHTYTDSVSSTARQLTAYAIMASLCCQTHQAGDGRMQAPADTAPDHERFAKAGRFDKMYEAIEAVVTVTALLSHMP